MVATTDDLRLHTRELLAASDRGEEVIISWRGKRRAKLVRWTDDEKLARGARNPAYGLWKDRSGDIDVEVRKLRQGGPLP